MFFSLRNGRGDSDLGSQFVPSILKGHLALDLFLVFGVKKPNNTWF